LHNWMR